MLLTREEIELMKFRYERRMPPTLKDIESVEHLNSQGIIKIQEKDGRIDKVLAVWDDGIQEMTMV